MFLRKLVLITILIVLSTTLMGCNLIQSKDSVPIELIAFNSLTDEEKDLIPASPKDSIVEKITVNDENKSFIDKNYDKDQVYAVTFNNTETNSSGKLTVFVDLDKETVVGKGFTSK
ncbi:hypothetical protein [Heyndrickxia oleronia]|uniref:hypothetical protein n=1 Tax=Heyndrickxia oleronia TaxID=38875 RepID=UPI00242F982E|nr:hypothetical protein [Heyndrickxia oleronia]MCI1592992.1 hypothetical protein [Heyndrickxia oleronia]MCI1615611.1 hypothetical protein [Heyndrickxia oleronia]MCI1745982.1 hypothetical protein [Heyndrickxia oleronia]MCI1764322.1 hypothetical protein [Heyndrickxia oleronia]